MISAPLSMRLVRRFEDEHNFPWHVSSEIHRLPSELISRLLKDDLLSIVAICLSLQRNLNRILAYVRSGQSRTSEDYHRLCDAVTTAWNRIFDSTRSNRPTELHGIFVMGSIIAGTEAGFWLPAAGQDKQWLTANMEQFRERAKYGDEDFKDLLKELEARPDLREADVPPAYAK